MLATRKENTKFDSIEDTGGIDRLINKTFIGKAPGIPEASRSTEIDLRNWFLFNLVLQEVLANLLGV